MDFDFDFDFVGDEDFGLAKSFTTAPIAQIAPTINAARHEQADIEHEFSKCLSNEVVADGICFKLAPGEDVS